MDKEQELNFYTGCSVGVHHELSCDYYMPYLDYVMFLCLKQATNAQKLKTVLYFHYLLKDKSPVPPSLTDLSPEFRKRILARCSKQNKMYPPYVPEFNLIKE